MSLGLLPAHPLVDPLHMLLGRKLGEW